MEMTADPSGVLMSDVLKGQVPDLEGATTSDALNAKHVIVVAEKVVGDTKSALVGILRGVLFDADPEIEFRIDLGEALAIVKAQALSFGRIELHHGDNVVQMPGPYTVKAARIDEISAADQLCTLGLHLKKPVR